MPDIEHANSWRAYAKTDYGVAVHDTSFHPVPIEIICYHCQQAAEKAFKSILAYHEQEIPKIHDLGRLFKLCVSLEPTLPDFEVYAATLTDYAITTRYPGDIELNEQDMKNALQYAKEILAAVAELWM